ncbi:MAG: helix-turn-helix domain-containing protein [Atopobiaceae bacterium]|nr:helix-turn-helix domain-containing protein [Atopobiaceae bacterium]
MGQSAVGYIPTTPRTSTTDLAVMLKTNEVAEIANCSRRHILNQLERGTIKGVRVGNTWRVPRDYFLHDVLGLEV